MKNENSAGRNEVKTILNRKGVSHVCKKKVLSAMLGNISKSIEAGTEYAQHISGKSVDETSAVCEWLCDNRYVFEKNLEIAKRSIKTKNIFTCGVDGKPRYYDAFLAFYRCYDDELDSDKILEFASIINEEKPHPTLYDLYFLETLIRIAVLSCVADVCKRLKNGNLKEDDAREIEKAVLSFRNTEAFRFERVFEENPAELVLRKDPSGFYDSMTKQTKNEYRKALYKLSVKRGIDEEECARQIIEKCNNARIDRERHVGFYLLINDKKYARFYFVLLFSVIAAVQTALFFVHPVTLLAFFPIWETVKQILDRVFALFTPKRGVPSLEISSVPDGCGVMCVITTLLTGGKNDAEIFDRLEKMYLSNGGKNVYFGVLADRTDSISASVNTDEKILEYAKSRIMKLRKKYGDVFFLFSRERRYSPSHKKFMAYERKRGAVNELCGYLCLKTDGFDEYSIKPDENISRSVKYCITLDADTNLPLGSVLSMTGAMLHPLNIPEINREKHVVTCGHGIMQPLVSTTLQSSGKTRFSRIMCGSGGTEIYSSATFDNEQSLFGNAVFCGKGIFDKNAFYEVTSGSAEIACDTVLSHDSIEGARLNCACLANVTLTDSFPGNELSYFKRAHRWIRGDVQNTVFLGKYVHSQNGEVISNRISALYKFRIFDNVRRALLPVFAVLCSYAGIFLTEKQSGVLLLSAIAYLFVQPFFEAVYPVLNGSVELALRRFFSKGVLTGLWQSLARCVFGIFNLAKSAFVSLDALIRSLYRMFVSKKNMLEWVTAAQTDEAAKDGLVGYVYKNLFSAAVGAALFVLCPHGVIRLLGLMWFFHPAFAYYTSLPGKASDRSISENDKNTLREYAGDIWKFFSENVSVDDNFLPIDNIQFFPDTIKARRTSPTNIGLYLVCVLCARDFGFIDNKEMHKRLSDTLETIEKMKKWKGHLYNWYDTRNLEVLKPVFVSGVDSGNLLACLLCVYEGLCDYTAEFPEIENLRQRLKALYDRTDLTCLYDMEKELFCIGAGFDREGYAVLSDNKYDLLMSEARTLSYIAVAKRSVPVKHWESLSRMPVRLGDRMGLASWTGTAFEYFMPALFLPVVHGSLFYEALCFALREQKKRRADTGDGQVWGISESAFFAFDYEMNYQYRAFGIPSLGLHRGLENDLVISPYSSFLSLCVSSKGALNNLRILKKSGMYGKYGFYEAADFTHRRVKNGFAKVKSVMAHHAGMSMAACANACLDNILQKRFMANAQMSAAQELLEEKIPVDIAVKTRRHVLERASRPFSRRESSSRVFENVEKKEPVCSMLSDGKNRIMLSSKGYIGLHHEGIVINRVDAENHVAGILDVMCEIDGEVFLCSCLSKTSRKQKFGFGTSLGDGEYITNIVTRDGKKFVFRVNLSIDNSCTNAFRISASLGSGSSRKIVSKARFAMCFEPVMMDKSAYESHPAFASLFVESEYSSEEAALLFSRRKRAENDREMFLGVGLCQGTGFEFATQKQVLCPLPVTQDYYKDIFKLDLSKANTGACENPFCVIRTDFATEANFVITFGYDRESVLMNLVRSRQKTFDECKKELSEKALHMILGTKFYPEAGRMLTEEQEMLSALIYPQRQTSKKYTRYENDMLWRHGISGDLPLFSAYADTAYLCENLERYVRAFMLMRVKGVKCELVLFCRDRDAYYRKGENRILRMVEKNASLGVVGKSGGIFIVNAHECPDSVHAIISRSSLVIKPSESGDVKNENANSVIPVRRKEYKKKNSPDGAFVSGCGYFLADGAYTVNKYGNRRVYSHVLSGRHLSCVVDSFSLGYTFSRNAAERRITPFYNDAYSLESAEHVYVMLDGKTYDLCSLSDTAEFSLGCARYSGRILSSDYTVNVFIPEKIPVKIVEVEINKSQTMQLCFEVKPIMGRERAENRRLFFDIRSGCVTFANTFPNFYSDTGFLFGVELDSDGVFRSLSRAHYEDGKAIAAFDNSYSNNSRFVFALGSAKNWQTLDFIMSRVTNGINELRKSAEEFSCSFGISKSGSHDTTGLGKSLSLFFDKWLPLQNGVCRFFARSGFYQSSGAFGFRDQLQDSLALMYSHPEMTRAHIIRCCAHQFEQGDVLHWWHPCTQNENHSHVGVRTRISDDYVFLPYAVCKYIEFTGDLHLLDVMAPYISAPELSEDEHEKYIAPSHSKTSESVYRHCLRSLTRACERTGEHGLCLIGTGDWCDGLNRIGTKGKGESVWLTMFLCTVIESFSKICQKYDDARCAELLLEKRRKLLESIENHGFDYESGYYLRAYTDSGRKIGVKSEGENKIELLPQAFAVFSHAGTPERRANALRKAFCELYDSENRIMKLFSPAYKSPEYDPGYIKGYCEGFRENGGQYTHAAVWMMMSLMEMSLDKSLPEEQRKEFLNKGLLLMRDMLVPFRMSDEKLSEKYLAEPYVLAADIYSNPLHEGKGGWTWYTGSAGWLWRALLAYCFCIEICDVMTDKPYVAFSENVFCVPYMFANVKQLRIELPCGKITILTEYKKSDEKKIVVRGKKCGMTIGLCEGENVITVYGG